MTAGFDFRKEISGFDESEIGLFSWVLELVRLVTIEMVSSASKLGDYIQL